MGKKQLQKYGQYTQLEKLGSGGNGQVYRVRNKKGEEFALKKLQLSSKNKRERIARFNSEVKIVSKYAGSINGILPILDFSPNENWYTMPIAQTILNYINEKGLTVEEIVSGVAELAETLAMLHERDISHRDIKPSNIYYYEGRFCLSDFGLVKDPEGMDNFTRPDRRMGAIFTIAPEMKRNPKGADAKKADVYSLAKTLWILLINDDKCFDGIYNFRDKSISLHNRVRDGEKYLAQLDEVLLASTDNTPSLRPDMWEFRKQLLTWIEMKGDEELAQKKEWSFLQKLLFGEKTIIPEKAEWRDINSIVEILNTITILGAYNHMMLPAGGGLDFAKASVANEQGCIYIETAPSDLMVLKPRTLRFESFRNDFSWNYFYLEMEDLTPVVDDNEKAEELLVEDHPGHYVSARHAQYGVYDYDTGEPLPEGYRVVRRVCKGSILIVMKYGPYNAISSTYDGRHSMVDYSEFSKYIGGLQNKYHNLRQYGFSMDQVLNSERFSKNPFIDDLEENEIDLEGCFDESSIADYYKSIHFTGIDDVSGRNNSKAKFCIQYQKNELSFVDMLSGKREVLCNDGYLRKIDSKEVLDHALLVGTREKAYELAKRCEEELRNRICKDGVSIPDYYSFFEIKILRTGVPTHLFTKTEIEKLMREADDRKSNVLVIDENGYAHILPNTAQKFSYPVRYETWEAGNNYVGKYSSLSTLEDVYIAMLEGWIEYLIRKTAVHKDYSDNYKSVEELVRAIQGLIDKEAAGE